MARSITIHSLGGRLRRVSPSSQLMFSARLPGAGHLRKSISLHSIFLGVASDCVGGKAVRGVNLHLVHGGFW